MFAVTEKGCWSSRTEGPIVPGGTAPKVLSPQARAALRAPRDAVDPSKRQKHGPRPDAIPETERISRGRKTGTQDSTWGIVIPALELLLDNKSSVQRTKKILLKLWRRSPEKMRQKSSAIVSRLSQIFSGEESAARMDKRLRRVLEREWACLIVSGFLHQLDAKTLRRIGLSQVADFINPEGGKPLSLLQCLLHCVIEFEKARDRKPALVLLDLIQNKDYATQDQIALSCWVLDLLDRNSSLSTDELAAKRWVSAALLL
ncbi:MAG: hypothetical protein KBC19_04285 [Candidatus Moranbacteria bacterium]|nr:hypothetical protein [Candidatus Moranbacteria bacterium]